MSEAIQKLVDFLFKFWPLYTVLVWERGVRVRFGRYVKLLDPGVHFRIPFFDVITLYNTRLRVLHTEPQTITVTGDHVLTVSATIGFRITDPLAAAMRHHSPEYAIRSVTQGLIAEVVAGGDRKTLTPASVAAAVLVKLQACGAGYEYDICTICDFGYLQTYRLMQSNGSQGWCQSEERRL